MNTGTRNALIAGPHWHTCAWLGTLFQLLTLP